MSDYIYLGCNYNYGSDKGSNYDEYIYWMSLLRSGYAMKYPLDSGDCCFLPTGRAFYGDDYYLKMKKMGKDLVDIFNMDGEIVDKSLFDECFFKVDKDTLSEDLKLKGVDKNTMEKLSIKDWFENVVEREGFGDESPVIWCNMYNEVKDLYPGITDLKCIACKDDSDWESYYTGNIDSHGRQVLQMYICGGQAYFIPCLGSISKGRYDYSESAIVGKKIILCGYYMFYTMKESLII